MSITQPIWEPVSKPVTGGVWTETESYDSSGSAFYPNWQPTAGTEDTDVDTNEDAAGQPPSDNWYKVTPAATGGRLQVNVTSNLAIGVRFPNADAGGYFQVSVQVYLPAGHVAIGDKAAMNLVFIGGTAEEFPPNETPVAGLQTLTYGPLKTNGTVHTQVRLGGSGTIADTNLTYYKNLVVKSYAYA